MTKQDKQNFDSIVRKYNQVLDKEYNSKRITMLIPYNHRKTEVQRLELNKYTERKSYGIDFNYKIDISVTYFYSPLNNLSDRKKGVIVVPIEKW